MGEHAVELVGLLGSFSVILVWVIVWFLKHDRKQIDLQAMADRKRSEGEGEKLCQKITEAKQIAREAQEKAHSVELNYTRKFGEVNAAVGRVETSVIGEIASLKDWMVDRFVTKQELRDALSALRNHNGEGN